MKIEWIIESPEVNAVKDFFAKHRENPFVEYRKQRNLAANKPPASREAFWKRHIACLLTTQQYSGPDGAVSRFIRENKFPLAYQVCREHDNDVAALCVDVLRKFGGIRRWNIISAQADANWHYLEDNDGWAPMLERLDSVRLQSTTESERLAASFIDDTLKGFGPKQSRNLVQSLGLSRFEVPIDGRLTRWLNKFGFGFKIKASALADRDYYNLVSEGFQKLADKAGIEPCLLDAAIFASYDGDGWTDRYMDALS